MKGIGWKGFNKHAFLNRSAILNIEADVDGGMGKLCGSSDPLKVMKDYGGRDDPLTTRDWDKDQFEPAGAQFGELCRPGGGGDPLTQPTSTYYQASGIG